MRTGYLSPRHEAGSAAYWERRYAQGQTSGSGSSGLNAVVKAEVVNRIIAEQGISSLIDLGCGDGQQLRFLNVERYLGLDVSITAIDRCVRTYQDDPSKSFIWYSDRHLVDRGGWLRAEATLSLEVLFHLIEDDVFERYMALLFDAAEHHVIVFAVDRELAWDGTHERYRSFTDWVRRNRPAWKLEEEFDPATMGHSGMLSRFYRFSRSADT